jgi:hypothetical protein
LLKSLRCVARALGAYAVILRLRHACDHVCFGFKLPEQAAAFRGAASAIYPELIEAGEPRERSDR